MRFASFLGHLIVFAATVLVGCGGGGGTSPSASALITVPATDAVDKYVGTWAICTEVPGPGYRTSHKYTLAFSKKAATTLSYHLVFTDYFGPVCAGTPFVQLAVLQESGEVTTVGTQLLSNGDPVDKLKFTVLSSNLWQVLSDDKDISTTFGDTLFFGDGNLLNTDGYPIKLDTDNVLTKQ